MLTEKPTPQGDPDGAERVRWAQVVEDAGLGTASIPMLMRAAKARNFSLVRMVTMAELGQMTEAFKAEHEVEGRFGPVPETPTLRGRGG